MRAVKSAVNNSESGGQILRQLFLLAGFAGTVLGNQSLVESAGVLATVSVPNAAPYAGLGSFYVDLRVHGWSLPASCQNIGQTPGGVNDPFAVQVCPSGQQPGMLRVVQFLDNLSGAGVGLNPPNVTIVSITFANPAVLTLAAALPATVVTGSSLHVINPNGNGTGCDALIGDWTVVAMNGPQVTVSADTSGCSVFTANSGAAAVDDFVFRWHRDQTLQAVVLETWNVDGTMYNSQSLPVSSFGSITLPQSVQFSDTSVSASLAYFRWYAGTITVSAKAPWGDSCNTGAICLGDWEFEGNGSDASGNGLTLSYSSTASYAQTPAYAPACVAGPQQSFRAGTSATLDGTLSFPLDGGTALSYVWQQFASSEPGTSMPNLTWSSQTVAQPTIDGLVFGPLNLSLTVTQSDGQSSSCSVHDGATATDASGNVVVANPGIKGILGPLLRWGSDSSRSPWLDTVTKQWADRLGSFQGTIQPSGIVTVFEPTWNNAVPGYTVSGIQGSGTLTFSDGYNAQTAFCSGGVTPSNPADVYIVAFYTYPISGGGGGTGRRFYPVTGCPTSSTVTINNGSAGWTPASQSGMQFSIIYDPDLGSWVNGSASINYYDNVLAFYAMYFRTGIDSYLHYARWLADNWWQSPWIDRGNVNDCAANASLCANLALFPRIQSYTGMFLRAIDQDLVAGTPGSSPMWPGIQSYVLRGFGYSLNGKVTNSFLIGDLRENSYIDMFVALETWLDPTLSSADRSTWLANLSSDLAYWVSLRQPDGHWQALTGTWTNIATQYPDIGNNLPASCTVTVTNGSPIVTLVSGSGCAWTPAMFTDTCSASPCAEIFTMGNPFVTSTQDSSYYIATFLDSQHAMLNTNYSGQGASGRNWVLSSNGAAGSGKAWIGFGTQPFMEGITGWMFQFMGLAFASGGPNYASQAAQAFGYTADIANWISKSTLDGTGGTDPATRGALYGVGFGICTPGASNGSDGCRCASLNSNCSSATASRENMGETLGELAQAYVNAPSTALQSAIDNVFNACYSKYPSNPGYDGTYCQDYDGFFWLTNNGKWLGFMLGMGRNAGWPSGRQGGAAPARKRQASVGFNLASVPRATQVQVTLIEPAGNVVHATCSTSPCSVETDTTQGNPLVTITYLSAEGTVLATSSEQWPIPVQ
ncbi:MAG TPA: hypothetical protein VMT15_08935 [Bryobacteraceae bacterium]|nr:hypothetical protein [Bryobacteraceae bacterium]